MVIALAAALLVAAAPAAAKPSAKLFNVPTGNAGIDGRWSTRPNSSGAAAGSRLARCGRAKPVVLARGSKRFKRNGRKAVVLKVARRKAKALRRARRLAVKVVAVATAPQSLPATTSRKAKLGRYPDPVDAGPSD